MENLTNKDWSNLPAHKPDTDLWDRIDTELDLQGVSNNLDQLPQYSPKINLWNSISLKLTYYQYLNYIIFAAIGISISVFLFLFINTSDNNNSESVKNKESIVLNQPATNNVNNILSTSSKINTIKENIKTNTVNNENKILIPEKRIAAEKEIFTKANNRKTTDQTTNLKEIKPLAKQVILLINEKENNVQKEIVSNDLKFADEITVYKPNEIEPIIKNQESNNAESNFKSENTTIIEKPNNIQNNSNESDGVEPKKVSLKSIQKPDRKGISSIGIDYTVLKIYNKESFSYAYNQLINQYGINYQYNYGSWLLQTGISYSKFSDNLVSKVQFQKDNFNTFNYVDSVIYNSQGEIIQYITHPVSINDSVIYHQYISASKKYSLLNIPILAGYQWNYGKTKLSLKTGFLCTMVISEKTNMILPVSQNIKVLAIELTNTSINGIKWAGVVSAAMSYDFTKRWGLSVEPTLYYYFKPLYDNMDLYPGYGNKSPWLFGIKTGLFYRF